MGHSHHIQIRNSVETCCSFVLLSSVASGTFSPESLWSGKRNNGKLNCLLGKLPERCWLRLVLDYSFQALVIRMPFEISRWRGPPEILKKTILYYRQVQPANLSQRPSKPFHYIHRHSHNSSFNSRDHSRIEHKRTSICSKCTSWSSLLPNPSYGSYGSARRHLETSRKRRVCT